MPTSIIGNYLTVPSDGGLVTASATSPDKYSTFDYFGDSGLIALDAFPDLYLGCKEDKGYLTTVDRKSAAPFTMPQSGTQDTVVSTMKGQVMATAGTYKGKVWYYLGGLPWGHRNVGCVDDFQRNDIHDNDTGPQGEQEVACARCGLMHAGAVRSPAVFSPPVRARRYCPA